MHFVYFGSWMRAYSYLNTAKLIIQLYDGSIPFTSFLKNFFRTNKKYGSKDRKEISSICFGYFRCGKKIFAGDFDLKLLAGLFLTSSTSSFILDQLRPDWNKEIEKPLQEKLTFFTNISFKEIFPFNERLSPQIDEEHLNLSFLIQPDLFIRIRPLHKEKVIQKLNALHIPYNEVNSNCIRFPVGVKIDQVINIDEEAVVQDLNSQNVLNSLKNIFSFNDSFEAWDCCAASGGKSILLRDIYPKVFITVSDIRNNILHNLVNRFKRGRIKHFNYFTADAINYVSQADSKFDLILCDVPCSGSGTWSRTPEQLFYFQKEAIHHYSNLQKSIVTNIIRSVREGGYILYITCSVFKEENEDVVSYITESLSLKLLEQHYYKGYEKKADTLFSALFKA